MKLCGSVAVFLLVLLNLSCSKGSVDIPEIQPVVDNFPRVKTRTSATEVTTFTYDVKGRVLTEVSTSGAKKEYSYLPNQIIVKIKANGPTSTLFYTLNTDTLVTKISNSETAEELHYEYNGDRTMARETSVNGPSSQVINFHYTAGSLDSLRFTHAGTWAGTMKYTFFMDKLNVAGGPFEGMRFFGAGPAYMIKRIQTVMPAGPGTIEDFNYEYNTSGLMTRQTRTYLSGPSLDYHYIYY